MRRNINFSFTWADSRSLSDWRVSSGFGPGIDSVPVNLHLRDKIFVYMSIIPKINARFDACYCRKTSTVKGSSWIIFCPIGLPFALLNDQLTADTLLVRFLEALLDFCNAAECDILLF